MSLRRTVAVGFVWVALFGASSAHAQSSRKMSLVLGEPPALEVELQYHDPSDLFTRLAGARVVPLWVVAKNISGQTLQLSARDVVLSLGGASGLVRLPALDPTTAQTEIQRATRLPPLLREIVGQGEDFGPNQFGVRFPDGNLRPNQSRKGFIFFLRPEGFQFDGFMTITAGKYAPELVNTGSIQSTVRTRAGSIARMVTGVINAAKKATIDIVYGTPFGRSYAILFGISDYDRLDDLQLVQRDLARMSEFLTKQGFDRVVVVANRDVTVNTLRNIQAHFQNQIQPEDRLLVYYSGHGTRSPQGDTGYLVLSKSAGTTANPQTEVPMRDFMSWILSVKVKHLLVLLDACHSGAAIGGRAKTVGESLDGATRERLYLLANQGSRFVITAGDADQNAHEDRRWDGGLFTNAVLRALDGKMGANRNSRLMTTFELFTTVKNFVLDEVTKNRLTLQTPLIQDLGFADQARGPAPVSKGEFVFVVGS